MTSVHDLRSLGIAAHIDAGKTTLAERVLFCTGRTHKLGEVHDGQGTMDTTAIEKRHGISIQAAATTARWRGHTLHLVDTPGHVDFTVEVERALRALDGAVLLLCAVAGVQAQTHTVDRQLRRHGVRPIVFLNKCDRPGADPLRVVAELRDQLDRPAVLIQLPLGLGPAHEGVVDLVAMEALRFSGPGGEVVIRKPVPIEIMDDALAARAALLDAASLHSDALTEVLLEEREPSPDLIHDAIRAGVLAGKLTPVLMGSAYRNKGVPPLLDAVVRYLPAPDDAPAPAFDADGAPLALRADADAPCLGLVFKVQQTRYGALSWLRLAQGTLTSDTPLEDPATGDRVRAGRLVRLHAGDLEPVEQAIAGEVVALFGVDVPSGTTLGAPGRGVSLPGIPVPEPVVEVALHTAGRPSRKLLRALDRAVREDPSLHSRVDPGSGELCLRGVGELQLALCAERLREETGEAVALSAPSVALRQTPLGRAGFDHFRRRQTGGPGQYARVIGWIEPLEGSDAVEVDWQVRGGTIPTQYRKAVERGFIDAAREGVTEGVPLVGLRVVVTDGAAHSDDSSDLAFGLAARSALHEAVADAGLRWLEPLMEVEAEAPVEHHGAVLSGLLRRRATILDASAAGRLARVRAEVPLVEMFGYAGALRGDTSGTGGFSMRFARYAPR
ncbi:MAG: elongation factor G [Alphaproteobacteria bacterium]|nr:elongation factor G [Alphaproteobacteria bacterium]